MSSPDSAVNLEVVTVPVSDVDRAKAFYQRLGWRLDADIARGEDFRVIQFTPPLSPCSVAFGTGLTTGEPGSVKRLILAAEDIDSAREDLVGRGIEVSGLFHLDGGRVPPSITMRSRSRTHRTTGGTGTRPTCGRARAAALRTTRRRRPGATWTRRSTSRRCSLRHCSLR